MLLHGDIRRHKLSYLRQPAKSITEHFDLMSIAAVTASSSLGKGGHG